MYMEAPQTNNVKEMCSINEDLLDRYLVGYWWLELNKTGNNFEPFLRYMKLCFVDNP